MFLVAYLLDSAPVPHHATDGTPVQGYVGMLLCIVTFLALSVVTLLGHRNASRRLPPADNTTAAASGGR